MEQLKVQRDVSQRTLMWQILAFYFPLAAAAMLMRTSFNIMNYALSQTLNPAIALAAFAMTESIVNVVAIPAHVGRQMLIAIGHSKYNFNQGLKVMFRVFIICTGAIALLGFTPIGYLVFVVIFRAPIHLYPEIQAVARVCTTLPLIYSLRSASQSVLMLRKRTHFVTISMIIRIFVMLGLAFIIPRHGLVQGAAVGAVVWVTGMAVEALLSYVFSRPLFRQLPDEPDENAPRYTTKSAFVFLSPLIITACLFIFIRPVINAGLAMTTNPELSLATYQVAFNFAWIMMALIEVNLHQIVLVFGTSRENIRFLRRFILTVSIAVSATLLILGLTPLGSIFLEQVIGVETQMAHNSRSLILVFAFAPLMIAWVEFHTGLVLRHGKPKLLTLGKSANLLVLGSSIFILASLAPQLGAIVGAVALLFGFAAELTLLHLASKYQKRHEHYMTGVE